MASHAQVAHAWAHKTGRQTNGHHMHYSGDTIYSYGSHFPIARHVTLPDGSDAVLFTTRGYSQSTSSHKSAVSSACHHLRVLLVNDPTTTPSLEDVTELMVAADEQMAKARRARTRSQMYIDQAARLIEQANELIVAFALPRALISLDGLAPELAQVRAVAAQARVAAQAKRRADQAAQRDAWLANQPGTRFRGTDELGNAYCRVSQDGTKLETSQGASVPLAHAKRVFAKVAECRANNKTWTRNGHTIRVGDFQVDYIDADGSFRAGCHTFAWPEIARVAQSIGLAV